MLLKYFEKVNFLEKKTGEPKMWLKESQTISG
jgi:hypothetical protein